MFTWLKGSCTFPSAGLTPDIKHKYIGINFDGGLYISVYLYVFISIYINTHMSDACCETSVYWNAFWCLAVFIRKSVYIHTTKCIYTVIHRSPTHVVERDYIHAFMQVGCIFPSMHGTEVAYTYNPGPILQTTYLHLLYLWTICICICVYIPWRTSPSWFRHT